MWGEASEGAKVWVKLLRMLGVEVELERVLGFGGASEGAAVRCNRNPNQ